MLMKEVVAVMHPRDLALKIEGVAIAVVTAGVEAEVGVEAGEEVSAVAEVIA
jgi:hypothetical protein